MREVAREGGCNGSSCELRAVALQPRCSPACFYELILSKQSC